MTGTPPGVSVLCDPDETDVLARFTTVLRQGRPVAVLDPSWPERFAAAAHDRIEEAWRQRVIRPGEVVLFSSGSTAAPRGLIRSGESWRASLAPLTEVIRPRSDDVVGIPGPLASTLFLYGAWHASSEGLPVVLRRQVRQAWESITVVHAVPGLVQGWPALPPRLRSLVLAGDRTPPELLARCRAAGVRVVEYYGSAEASFVLVGDHDSTGGLRPFPGVRVRLDAECRLWSRSPYAFRRYLPGAAGPARFEDGWLSVGDVATEQDGQWTVLGRPGAVTTGGHTVQIAEVETLLRRIPGVRDAVVVSVPHSRLGAVVGAVVSGDADPADLRAALQALPRPARPRRWLIVDDLPRTAAGKPDRPRAAALLDPASGRTTLTGS